MKVQVTHSDAPHAADTLPMRDTMAITRIFIHYDFSIKPRMLAENVLTSLRFHNSA